MECPGAISSRPLPPLCRTPRRAPPYQPAGAPLTITPEVDEPFAGSPEPYPQPYPGRPAYGGAPETIPAQPPGPIETVPLGPSPAPGLSSQVSIAPAATLACPLVSAIDNWMANSVQPAARRWFGQPVVEIKQISAYSCRSMNNQRGAPISEHAFGNALDIASFTLADGRKITVKNGWRGLPEEQGFLRDVQAAACDQFSTVLAPGSNVYHYDHIHVDLMRRRDGRRACNPEAVSGEEAAARAARYAGRRDPGITGSLAPRRSAAASWFEERRPRRLPVAEPGQDGEDD